MKHLNIGEKVNYKGQEREITTLDFIESLVGIKPITEPEDIVWVRFENINPTMSTHTEDTKNWWLSKFTKGLPTIITSSKTGETELHPEFVEALTAYASQVRAKWLREEIVRLEALINTNEADGHAHDPAIAYEEGCNDTIQTIIDRHQAELTTLTPKT